MAKFKAGDKVVVNFGVIATIVKYDEEANILIYTTPLQGDAVDTVYGHVSNTRLDPFDVIAQHALALVEEPKAKAEKPE